MTTSEAEIRAKLSKRLSLAIDIWCRENGSRFKPATYRSLAKTLNVDPGLISCWRCGKAWPRLDKISTVAKVLGVPVGWFWTNEPYPKAKAVKP